MIISLSQHQGPAGFNTGRDKFSSLWGRSGAGGLRPLPTIGKRPLPTIGGLGSAGAGGIPVVEAPLKKVKFIDGTTRVVKGDYNPADYDVVEPEFDENEMEKIEEEKFEEKEMVDPFLAQLDKEEAEKAELEGDMKKLDSDLNQEFGLSYS